MKLKKQLSNLPGDKSITHRAVMFSSLADGTSTFRTSVLGRDNFSTIRIFQQLGIDIDLALTSDMLALAKDEQIKNISLTEEERCVVTINSKGLSSLVTSSSNLDCGNSGTTARLLLGVLSATNFESTLVGDHSLSKRPFQRVTEPLTKMGSFFSGDLLPITVKGSSKLTATELEMKKASAQVKSALLIAGMYAEGLTKISEPVLSRDHTERMLSSMGVDLVRELVNGRYSVAVSGDSKRLLKPFNIEIPGDISAAMFYIASALVSEHEGILLQGVGINPTRSRCLDLLIELGGNIEFQNNRLVAGEPVADLFVMPSKLEPFNLDQEQVAQMIDEIPILSVLAAFIEGESVFRGAEELRVKESDRITCTAKILKSFGAQVTEYEDGLSIKGMTFSDSQSPTDNDWRGTGDHRIEMSASVMRFLKTGELLVDDLKAVETSFPGFVNAWE